MTSIYSPTRLGNPIINSKIDVYARKINSSITISTTNTPWSYITSIIGKKEIMEHANESFISSTFWTERIGTTAGLKTIDVMKSIKSWQKINKVGAKIKKNWEQLFKHYNLKVNINGIPSLLNFVFENLN